MARYEVRYVVYVLLEAESDEDAQERAELYLDEVRLRFGEEAAVVLTSTYLYDEVDDVNFIPADGEDEGLVSYDDAEEV